MLAEKIQIPVNNHQTNLSNDYTHKGDTVHAHIRRLTSRVTDLEKVAYTLRLTLNRIERKQYRELTNLPATNVDPQQVEELSTFGRLIGD